MRKSFLLLAIVSACAWAAAQENLVQNPGFEQAPPLASQPPSHWWLYQGSGETTVRVDRAVARSGNSSAVLQSASPSKCVLVSAPFPVTPGDELRYEAWARTDGPKPQTVQAGLAFRDADNKVFKRSYFSAGTSNIWSLISGMATAPEGAASAEVHLGYTNAPAALSYDDVAVAITSPISFSLLEGAKSWPGRQNIVVLAVNHQTNQFRGTLSAVVARAEQTLPVNVEPKATNRVTIPIKLAGPGTHNYQLSLLDASGAVLRTIEGKFLTQPPLALYPPCPCCHAAGEGAGDTRIDARVNVNPAGREGLRLKIEIADAAGKPIQTAVADASKGETVGVDVRVPVETPASFRVTARLIDGAGKEVAAAKSAIAVCAANDARVTITPRGFLSVAGEPVFPIGMYNSGHDEEMGKAGFNATHNYGITTGEASDLINPNDTRLLELLDRSWSNGLRMMVELPRKAIEKAQWPQIRRRIQTFRHHPGLLCWGSEERVARGAAPLTNVAALYQLVHELDPDHPFVLGDTRDVIQKLQVERRDFFPDACMDIGIWWWYPIPLKEPDGNGLEGGQRLAGLLEPPSWLTTTISKKPLWIAIQAYQKPSKDARFPTPAEYRCQCYLSIINGVKGLWFYVGSGQKDFEGKPAGLLNKPELAHWDYVQSLARELHEFSPVILAPASSAGVKLSPSDAPVQFVTRELNDKLYLIAANRSDRTQSVKFACDRFQGRRVQVLYENHPATIDKDTLADEFTPFGVHIYQLNPAP